MDDEERTTEELELFKKKINEDDRMDSVFRMGQNLTEKFDNRAYLHPHGMTDFDYKSMLESRRNDFEKFKHKIRHENYKYLGDHPELDGLLALFFKKLLHVQPQDPVPFAADYFTKDTTVSDYADLIRNEREQLAHYRVLKMKAAEKITTIPVYEKKKKTDEVAITCPGAVPDPCMKPRTSLDAEPNMFSDYDSPESLLNWLKKLNIGPLAKEVASGPKVQPLIEIKVAPKKKPAKPCKCKCPGRRAKAHSLKNETVVDDPLSQSQVADPDPNPETEQIETEITELNEPASPGNSEEASDPDLGYDVDEDEEDGFDEESDDEEPDDEEPEAGLEE